MTTDPTSYSHTACNLQLTTAINAQSPSSDSAGSLDEMRRQQRLLIVDDERSLRNLFTMALMDDNRIVQSCADGMEALEAVGSEAFDMVLLDLRMPRLDGIGFLRELRSRGGDERVVICSAELEPAIISKAISLGVVTFLAKPISLTVFRDAVIRHLAPAEACPLSGALRLAEQLEFGRASKLLNENCESAPPSLPRRSNLWQAVFAGIDLGRSPAELVPDVRRLIESGAFSLAG